MDSVLITGASSGIGYELAHVFAKNGYKKIILTARRRNRLEKLSQELVEKFGVEVFIFDCDLCKEGSCKDLFDFINENNISLDVLVNNAGFGLSGRFLNFDLNSQLNIIKLNVSALVELTGLFLPGMLKKNKECGILNIGSTAGFQPGPMMSVYYSSKAFVHSFSQGLAEELKGTNVHVTCFSPGPVKTEFGSVSGNDKTLLFKLGTQMDAGKTADLCYKAFVKKKFISVPGIINRISVGFSKFIPLPVLKKIVKILQSSC